MKSFQELSKKVEATYDVNNSINKKIVEEKSKLEVISKES